MYLKYFFLLVSFCSIIPTINSQTYQYTNYDTEAYHEELPVEDVRTLVTRNLENILNNYSWWRSPKLHYNKRSCATSRCGSLCHASYCPSDEVISIPSPDVRTYYQFGDAALAFVICHELAHHLQNINGSYPSETEADCIGGALMGALVRDGNVGLNDKDLEEMAQLTWSIGSYCGGKSHGTPVERTRAMKNGFAIGSKYSFAVSFNQCVKAY